MERTFNKTSKFLPQLEEHIENNMATIQSGQEVFIRLSDDLDGYANETVISIDSKNKLTFESDLDLRDPTRFPARIKAAATALRNQECDGKFRVSHKEGFVRIRRV